MKKDNINYDKEKVSIQERITQQEKAVKRKMNSQEHFSFPEKLDENDKVLWFDVKKNVTASQLNSSNEIIIKNFNVVSGEIKNIYGIFEHLMILVAGLNDLYFKIFDKNLDNISNASKQATSIAEQANEIATNVEKLQDNQSIEFETLIELKNKIKDTDLFNSIAELRTANTGIISRLDDIGDMASREEIANIWSQIDEDIERIDSLNNSFSEKIAILESDIYQQNRRLDIQEEKDREHDRILEESVEKNKVQDEELSRRVEKDLEHDQRLDRGDEKDDFQDLEISEIKRVNNEQEQKISSIEMIILEQKQIIEELQKEISYLKADMDTRFTRRESMIFAIIGLLGFLAAVVGFFI